MREAALPIAFINRGKGGAEAPSGTSALGSAPDQASSQISLHSMYWVGCMVKPFILLSQ